MSAPCPASVFTDDVIHSDSAQSVSSTRKTRTTHSLSVKLRLLQAVSQENTYLSESLASPVVCPFFGGLRGLLNVHADDAGGGFGGGYECLDTHTSQLRSVSQLEKMVFEW